MATRDRARMLSLVRARARSDEASAARAVAKALETLHAALERLGAADHELSDITVDPNEAHFIGLESKLADREAVSLHGLKLAFEGQADRAATQAATIRRKAGVRIRNSTKKN
jgi:hypothetical protein